MTTSLQVGQRFGEYVVVLSSGGRIRVHGPCRGCGLSFIRGYPGPELPSPIPHYCNADCKALEKERDRLLAEASRSIYQPCEVCRYYSCTDDPQHWPGCDHA